MIQTEICALSIDGYKFGEIEDYIFEAILDELTIIGIEAIAISKCPLELGVGDQCKICITKGSQEITYSGEYFSMIVPNGLDKISIVFRPSSLISVHDNDIKKIKDKNIIIVCRGCKEANPWAAPTFSDGTYICFTCRERKRTFS